MRRYILTGAPGAGKTAIIRWLESDDCVVVEESATDVIALEQAKGHPEPWTRSSFVDAVADLQRRRQMRASSLPGDVQFFDRSPICTYALSTFLDHPVPENLTREIERVEGERIYEKRVLFVENMGFVTPTAARRITLEETLRFEELHEEAYRAFGYECIRIPAAELPDRVAAVKRIALGS